MGIKYDLAITIFFLSILKKEDLIKCIKIIYEGIRKGGYYFYVDNRMPENVIQDNYELILKETWKEKNMDCHYNLYSEEKMKKILKSVGFIWKETVFISEDIYGMILKK